MSLNVGYWTHAIGFKCVISDHGFSDLIVQKINEILRFYFYVFTACKYIRRWIDAHPVLWFEIIFQRNQKRTQFANSKFHIFAQP